MNKKEVDVIKRNNTRKRMEEELLPYIPGTKNFNKKIRTNIIKELKSKMNDFAGLKSIDLETKKRIYLPFRQHMKNISIINGYVITVERSFVALVVALIILGSVFLVPFLLPFILNFSNPFISIFFGGWLSVVLSFAILRVEVNTMNYLLSKSFTISAIFLIILWLIEAYLIHLFLGSISLEFLLYILVSPLITTLFGVVTTFSIIILGAIIIYAIKDRQERFKFAESCLVHEHFGILCLLDVPEAKMPQAVRKKILRCINNIIDVLSHGLKKQYKTKDFVITSWQTAKINEMIAGVQSMAKSVTLPQEDNYSVLRKKVEKNFIASVTGNIGDFETATPEKMDQPKRLAAIWSAFRTIIISIIPISIVFFVQQSELAIKNQSLIDYLTLGSILWFVVTILTLLDSGIGARIAIIKDLMNLIPTSTKK